MTLSASLSDLAATGKPFGTGKSAPERIAVDASDIAVWQAHLDVDATVVAACAELLSDDESLRAANIRGETDRRRFVVARGHLRRLLANYLGGPPAAIVFRYSRSGKPFVAAPASSVHFNLSHSEDRALFAFSSRCDSGIDIEFLHRDIRIEQLARRFFTANECAALMKLSASNLKRAFLAVWTRKEALIKALGDGLALPLNSFEVSIEPCSAPRIIFAEDERINCCTLHTLGVGADYFASLAAYHGPSLEK